MLLESGDLDFSDYKNPSNLYTFLDLKVKHQQSLEDFELQNLCRILRRLWMSVSNAHENL